MYQSWLTRVAHTSTSMCRNIFVCCVAIQGAIPDLISVGGQLGAGGEGGHSWPCTGKAYYMPGTEPRAPTCNTRAPALGATSQYLRRSLFKQGGRKFSNICLRCFGINLVDNLNLETQSPYYYTTNKKGVAELFLRTWFLSQKNYIHMCINTTIHILISYRKLNSTIRSFVTLSRMPKIRLPFTQNICEVIFSWRSSKFFPEVSLRPLGDRPHSGDN